MRFVAFGRDLGASWTALWGSGKGLVGVGKGVRERSKELRRVCETAGKGLGQGRDGVQGGLQG